MVAHVPETGRRGRRGLCAPVPHPCTMAAKKKIAPPKPQPGRPWSELTKAEQNAEYVRALRAYTHEGGSNPETRGTYFRAREASQAG
jgi:hypothetical protein